MFTPEFIDTVVQNVMRELNRPASSAGSSAPAAADALSLSDQVITEELLQRREAAGRIVRILPAAVVTPSGRDYIHRHGIRLIRSTDSPDSQGAPPASGRMIVTDTAGTAAEAARTAGWKVVAAEDAFAAARLAAADGTCRTICCCRQPSVTACLLNRCSDRRAAVVSRTTCLSELCSEMAPDILCLNPQNWTFVSLLHLVRQFGGRDAECPAHWKELS